MIMIPIETPKHEHDMLLLVLDDTNLKRMAEADPAEAVLRQCDKTLVNPTIVVCHQNPTLEFTDLLKKGDLAAVYQFLARGFQFRPDLGDHDRGPELITKLE